MLVALLFGMFGGIVSGQQHGGALPALATPTALDGVDPEVQRLQDSFTTLPGASVSHFEPFAKPGRRHIRTGQLRRLAPEGGGVAADVPNGVYVCILLSC